MWNAWPRPFFCSRACSCACQRGRSLRERGDPKTSPRQLPTAPTRIWNESVQVSFDFQYRVKIDSCQVYMLSYETFVEPKSGKSQYNQCQWARRLIDEKNCRTLGEWLPWRSRSKEQGSPRAFTPQLPQSTTKTIMYTKVLVPYGTVRYGSSRAILEPKRSHCRTTVDTREGEGGSS